MTNSYLLSWRGSFRSHLQHLLPRSLGAIRVGFLALLGLVASASAQTSLNVTNFGARGDAVQFWVNTVSNSTLATTTNQVPSSAVGDAIEIYQAGTQTYGVNSSNVTTYGNQDMVAVITSIVNGTNIYMSLPASNTLTGAFATYGHNNQTNFQAAIAAATGTNTIINIPAGTYLFLTGGHTNSGYTSYGLSGITLTNGGITLAGAGTNKTILLSQGAWRLSTGDGYNSLGCWRGYLFEEIPPIANNYPVVFQNMTLDGGLQQGNTTVHGEYPNSVDGLGWDVTSDAFVVWSPYGGNAYQMMTWTNLVFQHWRGEIVKSLDQSSNGNLNMFNCVFYDGNATAINIYPSLNISNCVFNNLFQIGEYYQAYYTNITYFQSNLVTNISGNGWAINGGRGNNPPMVIRGNTFWWSSSGNCIETTPGDNIYISNNVYHGTGYGTFASVGCAGYQGTYCNSNVVINNNIFVTPDSILGIGGGANAADPTRVVNVQVYSNTLVGIFSSGWTAALGTWGWYTNLHFFNNDFRTQSGAKVSWSSGSSGTCQYALVELSTLYYYEAYGWSNVNVLSYGNGCYYDIVAPSPGMSYVLQDSDAALIPPGAAMLVSNDASASTTVSLYLNSAQTRGPITLTKGNSVAVQWQNNSWQQTTVPPPPPQPPSNLHVVPGQ